MSWLDLFGFVSAALMLLFYTLEHRAPFYVLAFAVTCTLSAIYLFLAGAWAFAWVEVVWTFVALKRWWKLQKA
jgi:hypothetical protein